jgi:DNA-directed RNA polymerase subunit beta'
MLYLHYPVEVVAKTMDGLKNLGFRFSTKSATTVSAYDIPRYVKKYDYFKEADESVNKLKRQFQKGLLTDDERYKKVVSL